MNVKQKISTNKISNYLREVSVVVIGVAITLSASYWLTTKNEKKDMKLYLSAVKLEMENNAGSLEAQIDAMQKPIGYANYLRSHDKGSLDADSIKSYSGNDGYYRYGNFYYKQDAFDMFKISGIMRLMNNKSLLHGIWNVYTGLNNVKDGVSEYNQLMVEEIKKEVFSSEKKDKDFIPMYNFYILQLPYLILQNYEDQLEVVNAMIERLDKELSK
jgi:hypothetical protein